MTVVSRRALPGAATADAAGRTIEFVIPFAKAVDGTRGCGDTRLAAERGDANADQQATPARKMQVVTMVRAGAAVPLSFYGAPDAQGAVQRDPAFLDILTFEEVHRSMRGRTRCGDILGDHPQTAGPASDSLCRTTTAVPPEARDRVRSVPGTQHVVRS